VKVATTGFASNEQIIDLVRQRFSVRQEFLREEGVIEFFLEDSQQDIKSGFLSLVRDLAIFGYTAMMRNTDHGILLNVFKKPQIPTPKSRTQLILLAATIFSIVLDGYIRLVYSGNSTPVLFETIGIALIYAVAILAIIGIHELGHLIAARHHGMDYSWPYFLPGIPGVWPTFGAVITARSLPVNRDALFDLGFSGPIAGLLATLVVSLLAVSSAILVPASSFPANAQFSNLDAYTSFLVGLLKNPGSGSMVVTGSVFNLLHFAYLIGFLITFLNLMPAWQLDGGHIANSVVSPKVRTALTLAVVVIFIVLGVYLMAFFIVLFAFLVRSGSFRPLDDVSPLSHSRKILFVLTWIMAACIFAFVLYGSFLNLQL
jgi:membrane-associated protease RseP (regulator of RpoE activity)